MIFFTLVAIVLATILALISFWLPSILPDSEKLSPYECGFDPLGSARLPYSMRFFLVAILFLLFDLEIALLLPTPWAVQLPTPLLTIFWSTLILLLLTLGFIYEWSQGGLEWAEWANSLKKTVDFDSTDCGVTPHYLYGTNYPIMTFNLIILLRLNRTSL